MEQQTQLTNLAKCKQARRNIIVKDIKCAFFRERRRLCISFENRKHYVDPIPVYSHDKFQGEVHRALNPNCIRANYEELEPFIPCCFEKMYGFVVEEVWVEAISSFVGKDEYTIIEEIAPEILDLIPLRRVQSPEPKAIIPEIYSCPTQEEAPKSYFGGLIEYLGKFFVN